MGARRGVTHRIGAHVSASGGLEKAVERALAIGAESLQLFVGSPQTWATPRVSAEEAKRFREAAREARLDPVVVHAPYLINLASLKPEVRGASRRTLVDWLRATESIGALGLVVHVGSGGDDAYELAVDGLVASLSGARGYEGGAKLLLENDAGSGRRIGRSFSEIGQLTREVERVVGEGRLGMCLDTAHALAAGYEIRTQEGLNSTIEEIEREVGLEQLMVVHANDSKVDLGKNVDRHDNIGRGKIGLLGFAGLLAHPNLEALPFILEVPGFSGQGPDRPNIELMRLLDRSGGCLREVEEALDGWRLRHFGPVTEA